MGFNSIASSKRPRVAIGPLFDEFGGVSQYIHSIKKYSSSFVSEIPEPSLRRILTTSVRGYKKRVSYRLWLYQQLMNQVSLRKFQIVHSQPESWFMRLCSSSREYGLRWVHTYHSLYFFEEDYPQGLQSWQVERNRDLLELAPAADVKISVSEWLSEYLACKYSIKTIVIPNGVDVGMCEVARSERFEREHRLGNFVLFVGSILDVKDPKLFVDLASKIPEFRFVMIGRGLDSQTYYDKYGSGVPANVRMLGEMDHLSTLDAISACRAFVITSKREGLPTSLLESMALRKPVVVPNHTGCKEVVRDERNGFLYESGCLDGLIERTRDALNSTDVGERAREWVLNRYDWRILIDKIDAVYQSLA